MPAAWVFAIFFFWGLGLSLSPSKLKNVAHCGGGRSVASEIKMANGQRDISNELPDYTKLHSLCVCDMLGVLNYFPGNFINAKNQDAFDEGGTHPLNATERQKKKRKNIYFNGSIKCIAMLQALRRNHNKSWPKRQCNNSAVVSLYSDFYCSSWRSFSSFQFGSVSGSFICFALFVLLDVCIAFFPCFFFFGMFAGNPLHGYPSPSTEITNIICEKSENVVYVIYVLVRKKGEKFGVSV